MDATSTRLAPARERDRSGVWHCQGVRLRAEHASEVTDLLAEAERVLDVAPAAEPDHVAGYSSARAVLGSVWSAAMDALDPEADAAPQPSARVVALMRAVKELDERILLEQLRYREHAFQRVRDALAALREPDSTAALVELAPATVCSLGFDRAIVSRIADSLWIPEKVHVERDPRWAEEILAVGRAQPQLLNGALIETEIVRRRVSILVDQVQDRPSVHRPIADASMSRSYTAAPVMVQGAVVGFLHADCFHQQRNVDDLDRQLLALFAEGFSQALSRTMVLDRLEAVRGEIDMVARSVSAARGGGGPWTTGGDEQALEPRRYDSGMETFLQAAPSDPSLTRREVEVLRLMAAGDTNARIARRLVISEGTVKSHVKHVLRKLGAANRAEAVSHWLRMGHEPRRVHGVAGQP